MNDELKDEIETLESVYNEQELSIDHKSDSQLLNICYVCNLDKYTQIKLEFSCKYSSNINCSISIFNGEKTKKIIPSSILDRIKDILIIKYKQEMDSMPIFQCISYCNDELMNDETLNLSNELKKLRVIDNDAYLHEMNKYRQQCQQNKKPRKKHQKQKNQKNEEMMDCLDDTMNEAVQELLKKHPYLLQAIPSMENVKLWLQSKCKAKDSKIRFIATLKVMEQFLSGNNKSKQFEVVYHGTSSQNDKSIVDRGLVCGGTKGVAIANGSAYGHGIYCSPSLEIANGYARGSIFICLVRSVNCKQSGNIYVVPNDNDILPIYLVNGTFCGLSSNYKGMNVNNKIIRFHNTFNGNVKLNNNRKVQRKWSAYHKLNC